jgi:hypothetical protein
MKTIQELEKNYRENDHYFHDEANQNDIGAPLDNSVTNDEEQDINQNLNNKNDLYKEPALYNEKDLNNNDPYPEDNEDEIVDDDLDDDKIEDEDLEDDLDDEDDFQEDDLEDADGETDATNPRNPSQF